MGMRAAWILVAAALGPAGPWTPFATDLPDNGRFQWTVPPTAATSTTCHVRITLRTATRRASRINPIPFTIE